jgi:hypothetical protein
MLSQLKYIEGTQQLLISKNKTIPVPKLHTMKTYGGSGSKAPLFPNILALD